MTRGGSKLGQQLKEAELSADFCEKDIKAVQKLINSSTSFSVVGLPAMGISIFLRYLCTKNFGLMVHVDIYELLDFSPAGLFKLLSKKLGGDCQRQLSKLVRENERVIIVFNRFDSLKKSFSREFFANLRSLIDVDKEKIVMIFAANRPLPVEFPAVLEGGNLGKFSVTYYLQPFSSGDLKSMLKLNSPALLSNHNLEEAIKLSGGHYQLLILLLKSEFVPNYMADPIIQLQLKQLYGYLNYKEKKHIQRVALGKEIKFVDPFLKNVGYLNFSPLFNQLVRSNLRLKLPVKEAKLFEILKEKQGKVVLKDDLFEKLWSNETGATDWALNALVYRLRKNPTFVASGFQIESQKKMGYTLIKT